MSNASEITICHANEIAQSEQNLNLPLESYSPWSPCIIDPRNEMCDHSSYAPNISQLFGLSL